MYCKYKITCTGKKEKSDTHGDWCRECLMNRLVPALHLIRDPRVGNSRQITEQSRSMKFNTALSVAATILLNIAGKSIKLSI